MQLYNSLTQTKEIFIPLKQKQVRMYVCGITPYDTTHLGHAFTYTIFDILQRYLTHLGYNVTYTQNVTDIDDDILQRARKNNQNWKELGEFWVKKFLTDLKNLNVQIPTHYVKATESMSKIIEIIALLMQRNIAYQNQGNIYFDTTTFPDYGKLSKFTPKQMFQIASERGGNPIDPLKKHPLDFLLWQTSKSNEPSWVSPWGNGRPGWHIECSAMVHQYLGQQIDIHGGGRDLIYPHHESEIAQSESFTGKTYVKYWMHTAMVIYQGEKMAKSLGNLIMVSDLLKTYSPNSIRWLLLSHHYRTPWEFTKEEMETAQEKVLELEKKISRIQTVSKKMLQEFITIMDDDLNTPKALELLTRLVSEKRGKEAKKIYQILGFLEQG